MASAALLERAQAISNSDKDKGIELYSKIGKYFCLWWYCEFGPLISRLLIVGLRGALLSPKVAAISYIFAPVGIRVVFRTVQTL